MFIPDKLRLLQTVKGFVVFTVFNVSYDLGEKQRLMT
jgi:hypothetical protein